MRHLHGEHIDEQGQWTAGYANLRACLPGHQDAVSSERLPPNEASRVRFQGRHADLLANEAVVDHYDKRDWWSDR